MDIFEIDGLDDLPKAAKFLIDHLDSHSIVAFYGRMGAGKTTLIAELIKHLGSKDTATSPTFSIVNRYDTDGGPVYHFDFYRINRPEEAFDIGYEEYFYSGDLCLVEWPEKIESLLPDDTLRVHLAVTGDDTRTLSIE